MSQQLQCKCGSYVDVPDPRLELINELSVSMIIWSHGEPTTCTGCGSIFIGHIVKLPIEHIQCSYAAIPKDRLPDNIKLQPQKSRIISPFGR